MTTPKKRLTVGRRLLDWTNAYTTSQTVLVRLWNLFMTWPTAFLDILYDRFGLWQTDATTNTYVLPKRADYSKVRGLILYATVVWFTLRVGLNAKSITLGFMWFLLCILAASISERVFTAAIGAWAGVRTNAAAGSSDDTVVAVVNRSALRDPILGIDPPKEPVTKPTGTETGAMPVDPVLAMLRPVSAFVLPASLTTQPSPQGRTALRLGAPMAGLANADEKRRQVVTRVLITAKGHAWGQEDRQFHHCKVGVGTGDNHGQFVEFVQHNTGNGPGDPWCMSYVCSMMKLALGTLNPLPMTGGVQWMYEWAVAREKKTGLTLLFDQPELGDVFLLYHGSLGRYAHTGFVNGTDELFDGTWEMRWAEALFFTVEGNTNTDGSRDGFGVFERYRPVTGMKFLRWKALIA